MNTPPRWQLDRYMPLVRVLARRIHLDARLRVQFDWSDLVSETLLRAHAGLNQFRGETEAELIGWLKEVLANTLRDKVRAQHARKRDINLELSLNAAVNESSARLEAFLAAEHSSPSFQAERHEMLLHLAEALEALPEDQRFVVMQRDLLGASIAEIARDLQRSEKSVAGLLLRGRRKLRDSLEKFR
jgi:RNA polymerase sigma-70 factor (ECF subfamily)